MAKKMVIDTKISESFPLEEYLQRVDWLVRREALDKALRAAGKVVIADAKQRIPRSSKTGTGKKKSKSQQDADRRRRPLADSIATKIVKKNDGALVIGITGQKLLPEQIGREKKSVTAHGHLLEFGHRAVYWGRSNWQFGTKQETGGFRFRLRADGTRRSDERLIRSVRVASLVGGPTRSDFVQAKKWLAPAADTTRPQQHQAIVNTLSQMIASQR